MKIILVGPPGVGKGSQAELLQNYYNVKHVSTGNMFRENLKNNTKLGILARSYMDKGKLVPDSITNDMVDERLSRKDVEKGFLLDGYPRNKNQAISLDKYLEKYNHKLNCVLLLVADDDVLINRISGRRVCLNCGLVFHIVSKKPKKDGICDGCGNKLIQRSDDTVETIKTRLDIYHKQAKQLIDHYKEKGLIVEINGELPIDEGFKQIVSKLGEVK